MNWQDIVLTGGNIFFIIALFPSILSKNKPALATSLLTGGTLLVFTFTFFTLSLWFTTVATLTSCLMWFTLAFQVARSKKK